MVMKVVMVIDKYDDGGALTVLPVSRESILIAGGDEVGGIQVGEDTSTARLQSHVPAMIVRQRWNRCQGRDGGGGGGGVPTCILKLSFMLKCRGSGKGGISLDMYWSKALSISVGLAVTLIGQREERMATITRRQRHHLIS
jgi:hypothetical protein